MYNKHDKRRLYWLINQYLSGKINETIFCDDFHDTLVNEMYYEGLTDIEYETFSDLSDVSQRFSEYEEDITLWKGFYTAEQLKQKIIETKEKLQEQSPI
jgi:tRNA U54 and U55 pseudouridine synthase Pus10